jgi:hypothetical protein
MNHSCILDDLWLLPNSTAGETFLHNWERWEWFTGCLPLGVGRLDE